ncbi:MAG: hypothetical protein R3C44_18355 [Chloroflexota bacterium]
MMILRDTLPGWRAKLADFFLSSADYGYYRPVVFAVLRLTETVFGGHVPVADHALLLVLQAANAAMVWLLAYRLSNRQLALCLGGGAGIHRLSL